MQKLKDIASYLESIAPLAYQESYDNSGLITGNGNEVVKGLLVSLDCTEKVVDEAIQNNCNMIVAHHPIVFKGLKRFTGNNYVERTIIKAIKNDIAIYAIHTNLDNVNTGVSRKIADILELINSKTLSPKSGILSKLVAFVPESHTNKILKALHSAGAGNIGDYSNCSFTVNGKGTFIPNDEAEPFVGNANVKEEVNEDRVEVIFPSYLQNGIVNSLKEAHPYQEVAYYITELSNLNQEVGSGIIGELEQPMKKADFLSYLKKKMNLNTIRYTNFDGDTVQRIAICGGAGSFLLPQAKKAEADVFITGDFKYHEFFDAENEIMICDIGHYESEVFTKDLIIELLNKKFTTFAICLSEVNTNPISYF